MKPTTEHLVSVRNSLVMILVTLVLLTGCGGASPSQPNFQPPTQRPINPTDTPIPTVTKDPAKPRIDVVIDDIELPSNVKRDATLNLTVVVRNNSVGSQAAGIANVEVRASISGGSYATERFLANLQFRNLQFNVAQEDTISVTAPNLPGLWKVTATVSGFDYEDPVNNRREVWLDVD